MLLSKLILTSLAAAILSPGVALAIPAKYSKCSEINFQPVEAGTGYYFSDDCKSVYILPPRIGKMSIDQYQETGSLENICSTIESIEESNKNYHAVEEIYTRRMKKNAEEIIEKEEQIASGNIPEGKTVEDLENEILELTKKSRTMRKEILDFHSDYVKRMQHYAQREGSAGVFLIENSYNQLVEEFKQKNSTLNLNFKRIPLEQSYLSIVDKSPDPDINKVEMGAVLSLQVPGLSQMPLLQSIGNELNPEGASAVQNSSSTDIFGDALSGEIRMSAIGACGTRKESVHNSFSMKDIQSHIAANATYQYQVKVRRRHSLTFKMRELVRRIHEQTKKGGFFSRKTINRLIDERHTSSWITFHSESDDVRFEYTDEYIKEIKREFIDRALRQIITAKTGNTAAQLALLDPSGQNGADVIGQELGKCPHIYCQIGAAAFKVLSSIFGSETATSELVQKFQADINETVLNEKMVPQVGTMTFK